MRNCSFLLFLGRNMSIKKVSNKISKLMGEEDPKPICNAIEFLCLIIAKEELDSTDGSPSPTLRELRVRIEKIKSELFGKRK